MRWLPELFLLILIASLSLLSGSVRGDEISHQKQNLAQQTTASYNADTPRGTIVAVNSEESASHEPKDHEPPEIRVIVPPVTVAKDHFDYAVPLITLLFAGALVFVGIMQWRTYEAQKVILHQQTILAHRPRIKIREVHLVGELAVDQPIEVCLSLINSGETQATIISSNFTVNMWDQASTPYRDLKDGFQLPEPYDGDIHYFESQITGAPILPAGIQTLPIRKRRHLMFQPHERQQFLEAKSHTVFAIGYVFYRNDAGQHHKTGFCYRYDYVSKRFRSVPDPDLTYEY